MNHIRNAFTVSKARNWAAAALFAGMAAGAMAQTQPASPAAAPAVTAAPAAAAAQPGRMYYGPALTIRQIYDQLDAAGYRDLREIEWSDGRYEVKGRNAQGARVKLELDGNTGAILRERIKR